MTEPLEFPRHVHKGGGWGIAGGESKVVTEADFAAALADGWVVDPNESYAPITLTVTEVPALAAQDVAGEPPDADDGEPAAEQDEGAGGEPEEAECGEDVADEAGTTAGEAVERTKRKPGRPRRS